MNTRPTNRTILHQAARMLSGARRIAIALLVMMLTTLPAGAQNPTWLKSGDTWNATTKTLTVNSNPVEFAYRDRTEIEHLVISSHVTTINEWAFISCANLATITFAGGSQLTTIGQRAFYNCRSLTAIEIPASVTTINNDAFSSCKNLATVTFANGTQIKTLPNNAFSYCTSLTAITIPASVTSLSGTFPGCTSLASVTFAEGSQLTTIGGSAFEGCKGLTAIEIPTSVTTIGGSAFAGSGLTAIEIPTSVATIGGSAFYKCTGLTAIEIPTNVTTIGGSAFKECTSLATVTFTEGSQLTTINDNVFKECTSLTAIEIPNSVTTINGCAFFNCTSLTAINIPASVTTIYGSAFENCTSLETVTFTEGSTINHLPNIFTKCTSLTAITIPATVTSLSGTFPDCTSLASVTFAEGSQLKTIDGGTFENCTSLTTIEIPSSVTSIQQYVFTGCTNLTTIVVAEGNENYKSQEGLLLTKDGTKLLFCPYDRASGNYTIPNGVTDIVAFAFLNCTGLTSVTIPASVTSIEGAAFDNCTSLETVTFAEGSQLTNIYGSAFNDCSSLKTFNFADNTPLKTIGNNAFSGCSALESIALPDHVKTIMEKAFEGCTSLTTIHIPASLTTIKEFAFKGCTNLTSFTVDATSETFASDDGVLVSKDGTSLVCYPIGRTATSYIVPANTTAISAYTFQGCTSLESVTLPAALTEIGVSAFKGCTGLTSIVIPPNAFVNTDAFKDCTSLTTATILNQLNNISDVFGNVNSSCHFYIRKKQYLFDYSDYSSRITILPVINTTCGAIATPQVNPAFTYYGTDYYTVGATFTISNSGAPNGYTGECQGYQVKDESGSNITATALNGTTLTLPESDVTVKSLFAPITYNITYEVGDANFNSADYAKTYTIESETFTWSSNAYKPNKNYYNFTGWTGPGYDNPSKVIIIPKGSYGDRKYTAHLQPNEYSITYDLAGGTLPEGVTNPSTFTIETETFTLNNPQREDYLFVDWRLSMTVESLNPGSTGGIHSDYIDNRSEGTSVTIPKGSNGNREYTAKWVYILNEAIGINDEVTSIIQDQSVVFLRTSPIGKKQTICLPFEPNDLLLYGNVWEFTGIEDSKAVMTQRRSGLQANKPYIFEATNDASLILFGKVNTIATDPKTESSGFTFHGTYSKKHWDADDSEVVNGTIYGFMVEDNDGQQVGQFVRARRATNLRAFSCYLEYNGELTGTQISNTRGEAGLPDVIDIVWQSAGSDATGISDMETMRNEENEVWFSLDGRRLSGKPSKKGIYIHNGRKEVVR